MDTKGGAGGSAASATPADPPDVLDREKCLEALAQLRHSKWFQVRCRVKPMSGVFHRRLFFSVTYRTSNDEAAPEKTTLECLS